MKKVTIDLDALTKRRDELADAKARYTFELKQVEKEIETLDLQLMAVLNQAGVEQMQFGSYSFGWETKTRRTFDQKLFGSEHPDLLEQYKIEKENRVFNFRVGGA